MFIAAPRFFDEETNSSVGIGDSSKRLEHRLAINVIFFYPRDSIGMLKVISLRV